MKHNKASTAERLVNHQPDGYNRFVAEKEATGRGTPKLRERTTVAWRYFFVCTLSLRAFFNGRALMGTASAVPALRSEPVFQPCHVPALPLGTGKRIHRNEGDRMHFQTKPGSITSTQANQSEDRAADMAELVNRISSIDGTLSTLRDFAYLYADMVHELPDEKQTVTVKADAARNALTFIIGRLEDAIDSLGDVHAMVSLLDDKSSV